MKNKGFTFIEILATIVILGLLGSIAIIRVSKYKDNAIEKDYEAIAQSAYNGMEQYMSKNSYENSASLEELEKLGLISSRVDPASKSEKCTGRVVVDKSSGTNGGIDSGVYKVHLCCTNYKKTYTYPEKNTTDLESESYCN